MTQQYNNNNKTFALIKWLCRKHLPFIVAYTSILFLVITMPSYLEAPLVGVVSTIGGFTITIASIIIGVKMTSYLHNKREVDMVLSLPVKRNTLLISNYTTGLIILIVPFILAIMAQLPMMLFNIQDYIQFDNLLKTLTLIANVLLNGILIYTFTTVVGLVCGQKSNVLTTVIVFNIVVPLTITVVDNALSRFIPGVENTDTSNLLESLNEILIIIFAPVASVLSQSYSLVSVVFSNEYGDILETMIIQSIVIVAFLVLAYFVNENRKAEIAQTKFAYNIIPIIIKFVSALTFSCIATDATIQIFNIGDRYTIGEAYYKVPIVAYVLLIALYALIVYIVATYIYDKSFRGIKKHFKIFGIIVGSILAVFFIITTGFFGTDTYVPNSQDVKCVYVLARTENTANYSKEVSDFKDGDMPLDGVAYIKGQKGKELIVKAHQSIVDAIQKEIPKPYNLKYKYYTGSESTEMTFEVKYIMNNGSTTCREYTIPNVEENEVIKEKLQAIASSEEYKKSSLKIFNEETSEFIKKIDSAYADGYDLEIDLNNSNTHIKNNANITEIEELQLTEALKKDILADDKFMFNYNNTESADEYISFVSYRYYPNEKSKELNENPFESSLHSDEKIAVPFYYSDTVEILDKLQKKDVVNKY